jgi:hypothetical protein
VKDVGLKRKTRKSIFAQWRRKLMGTIYADDILRDKIKELKESMNHSNNQTRRGEG